MTRLKDSWLPVLFLAFVVFIWLWPITIRGQQLSGIQFTTGEMPRLAWYASQLKAGRIPIWNEADGFGVPILAEGRVGVFYPPNLVLYRLFDFSNAYRISVIVHFFIASLFAYLCARGYQLSRNASVLTALVFVGQGFFIIHTGHQWALTTVCWLPLAILALQRWFDTSSGKWLILLSVALAMQLLAAHLQIAAFTQVIVLAIAAVKIVGTKQSVLGRLKNLAFVIAAWIGALAAAAVQLVPTAEYLVRADWRGWDWNFLTSYALPPLSLGNLIAPQLMQQNPIWQNMGWVPWRSAPTESLVHVGLIPLGLAIWTIPRIRLNKDVRLWIVLSVATMVLALGTWLPGSQWLIELPIIGWFSAAARWTVASGLFLGLLGGWALDQIEWQQFRSWMRRYVFIAVVGLAIAVTGIVSVARGTPRFSKPVDSEIGMQLLTHGYSMRQVRRRLISPEGELSTLLTHELTLPAVHLLLLLLLTYSWPFIKQKDRLIKVIVVWTAIDLGIAASLLRRIEFGASASIDEQSPVLRRIDDQTNRIAGTPVGVPMAIGVPSLTEASFRDMKYIWEHNGGIDSTAWKISAPSLPDLHRWGDFTGRIAHAPDSLRDDEFVFLRLAGIEQIVLGPGMGEPKAGLPLQKSETIIDDYLSKNLISAGTEFLPESARQWTIWKMGPGVKVSRAWMFPIDDPPQAGTDPRLVRRPPPARREMLKLAETANVTVDTGEFVQIEGTTNRRSVIVLSDTAYPGWEASRIKDGESIPMSTDVAFGGFRAVTIPDAGPFQIEFHYRPHSFVVGKWISLGAILFGVLCLVIQRIRSSQLKPAS